MWYRKIFLHGQDVILITCDAEEKNEFKVMVKMDFIHTRTPQNSGPGNK